MVSDETWLVEQFETQRARLRAVAYRMLGSVSEAEDAVQEAWLRLNRADDSGIDNLAGWLTTVVGRVCLDMLRARRSRREHYVGTWLPEPIVSDDEANPEQQSLLTDSVGLALLVVLETLTPAERLAFVLHDMFAVPFDQIAPMLDRTPEATRKLASRARHRVRGAPAVPDPDLTRQRRVVDAFLAAARSGDFDSLLEVLDPDVVFRVDRGRRSTEGPPVLTGATAVATRAAEQGPRFATFCHPALVNGAAGFVVRGARAPIGVVGMTVIDDRITEIDLVLNPDKLTRVDLPRGPRS